MCGLGVDLTEDYFLMIKQLCKRDVDISKQQQQQQQPRFDIREMRHMRSAFDAIGTN